MKRLIDFGVVGMTNHRRRLVPVLLLVSTCLMFSTAVSAAQLVINGGFEEPVVPTEPGEFNWFTYYGKNFSGPPDCPPPGGHCSDDTLVPGWSVFWTDDIINNEQLNPGRLELQTGSRTGIPPAFNGTLQKAELDSHHRVGNSNTNVTITQQLPTCPLTAYALKYAWKSRTEVAGDNDVRVVVGDELVNIHAQNLDWEMETVDFVSDNSNETLLLFGSIGSQTTTGMFLDEVSVTGPDGRDPANCSLVCDDKPIEITLRYDGDDDSDHQQSGNEVIISPEVVPSYPAEATILVYNHMKKRPMLLGEFSVAIGGFLTVNGPRKRIPPRLTFEIWSAEGDLVQTITFHTSCSQPLDAGDEFGAITVWSAVN